MSSPPASSNPSAAAVAAVEAPPSANLDALGIFWIVYTLTWTCFLAAGMVFLLRRRDMPMLRIRGLPLSFAAVALLHCYWGAGQTAYVYGSLMSSKIEYWVMGIWLPFGIALFHASNSRFLYVASVQRRFVSGQRPGSPTSVGTRWPARRRGVVGWYKSMDYSGRMLTLVGIGMVFQVRLCKVVLSEEGLLICCGSADFDYVHVPHLAKVS